MNRINNYKYLTNKPMKSPKTYVLGVFAVFLLLGGVAFAQSDKGLEMSEKHRSAISKFVNELNAVADRDGGIGEELKEVAKEQNEAKEKTAEVIEKVEKRGGLKTFLFGTDYKNIGKLRSEMVTTGSHLNRLNKAKERADDSETIAGIEEQITALEEDKSNIEGFIAENESKFSLFGWLVKLFN